MTTRISVLGAISLLLTTAAAATAQRDEAWIDEALVAEFQSRSATLSAALEQADVPILDSLVAPGFAATLGLGGGTVFYVPRSSWLRRPQEIAGLEEHDPGPATGSAGFVLRARGVLLGVCVWVMMCK